MKKFVLLMSILILSVAFVNDKRNNDFDLNISDIVRDVPVCTGNMESYFNTVVDLNHILTSSYMASIEFVSVSSQLERGSQEYEAVLDEFKNVDQIIDTLEEQFEEIDHPNCMTVPLISNRSIISYWQDSYDSYVRAIQAYVVMVVARGDGNVELSTEGYARWTTQLTSAQWNNGFFFGQMLMLVELQSEMDAGLSI